MFRKTLSIIHLEVIQFIIMPNFLKEYRYRYCHKLFFKDELAHCAIEIKCKTCRNISKIKRTSIFIIILFLPLAMFAATSENYKLDQEGIGFVEFDGNSSNYEFKAAIGSVGAEQSVSTNYIIDQGRVWTVTEEPDDDDSGDDGGDGGDDGNNGGGGGGGGGGSVVQTGASFFGRAYPLSSIRLLKDGQAIATTVAGPDAYFSITALGINSGSHAFIILGVDGDGLTSQSQSFSIEVSPGVITVISGIFLAPTLTVDKSTVKQGDNLAIFGKTVPESTVTIGVASNEETFRTTQANDAGVFLYNLDTAPLVKGDHETRAKSAKDSAISDFGRAVAFIVGDKNITKEDQECTRRGDMNNDCRVNLVDFSIVAFWYERELSEAMRVRESAQLNGDGVINLIDLSIMAYYWTG